MLTKTTLSILAALALAGPVFGSTAASAQSKSYVKFRCEDETRPEIFRPQGCATEPKQRARVELPPSPPTYPPRDEPANIFEQLQLEAGGGDGDGGGGGR